MLRPERGVAFALVSLQPSATPSSRWFPEAQTWRLHHRRSNNRRSTPRSSMGPTAEVLTLALDHDAAMVGVARRAVDTWLRERGCSTGDDAVLVLSELVTNALVHAADGCTIEARHRDDLLRLEVRDRSPEAPVMKQVGPTDIGGLGLVVVDAVAEEWGWEPDCGRKARVGHRARPVATCRRRPSCGPALTLRRDCAPLQLRGSCRSPWRWWPATRIAPC